MMPTSSQPKRHTALTSIAWAAAKNAGAYALALVEARGEPRIDSKQFAKALGNTHAAVMRLVKPYSDRLKNISHLVFQMWDGERKQGGGKAERVALLTENQALFLLTLSRNTERVVTLKARMVQAFAASRRDTEQRKTKYLPQYHQLHDRIKELTCDSDSARYVHMNVNRLVNGVVGIEAGQRNSIPVAMLTAVNHVAALAMAGAVDHRDGYQRVKVALGTLQGLLEPPQRALAHG